MRCGTVPSVHLFFGKHFLFFEREPCHAAHSCKSFTEVHTERGAGSAHSIVRHTPAEMIHGYSVKDEADGLMHSCFLRGYVSLMHSFSQKA